MLDIPPMAAVLEGVKLELEDCALAHLSGVEAVTTEEEAFKGIDYAFLVGAMPRKEGMERKDRLAANVKIFKSQGQALAKYANPDVKVGHFTHFTEPLSSTHEFYLFRCWWWATRPTPTPSSAPNTPKARSQPRTSPP